MIIKVKYLPQQNLIKLKKHTNRQLEDRKSYGRVVEEENIDQSKRKSQPIDNLRAAAPQA